MPRLKNRKHEAFVHKLIENNGDKRKAYSDVYGEKTFDTSNASDLVMNRPEVIARINEVMHLVYNPTQIKKKLTQLMNAQKPVIYNGEITGYYDDNANQLETLKLFLKSAKVLDATVQTTTTNNVQFNVNVIDPSDALNIAKEIKSLTQSIKREPIAKKINAKQN